MDLEGERVLPVDRETAWNALNDVELLKDAIGGCESFEAVGKDEYAIVIAASLGPVRAKFRGRMHVEDIEKPDRYTLRFSGEGGLAGFVKGSAKVHLSDAGEGTRVRYSLSTESGGRIAKLGRSLFESGARQVVDDFFTAFEAELLK
jgi:carbon monoxide dehydrogenase subunit G